MTLATVQEPQSSETPCSPAGSSGGTLIRNSLLFGSVSFVAYLLSLAKTILVSRFFGTSPEMDAFTVAILVPNLLGSLITGSAAAGLVPALTRAEREGAQRRSDVFRTSFLLVAVASTVATVALVICAAPLMRLVASRFDGQRLSLAIQLSRWAAPLFVLNAIYGFGSAELLARRKYALVAFAPATSTVLATALIAAFYRQGAAVLVWALVAGTVVQAALVLVPALRFTSAGSLTNWRDPYVIGVLAAQVPLLAASSIGVVNTFVDQFMAALLPTGNVSALNYANSLNVIAMQMVVMSMSWVVLPDVSAIIAAGDFDSLRRRVRLCVVAASMLAAPACVAIVIFGEQAIRIVFQHGRFHADSTSLVYRGWMGYSVGLIAAGVGMIAVRVANGLEENWLLFRIGIALFAANSALDYVLMHVAGVLGIGLSTSLVYCLSCLLLYTALRKRVQELLSWRTVRQILLAVGSSLAAAMPALAVTRIAGGGLGASVAGAVTFVLVLLFFYRLVRLVRFDWSTDHGWRAWRSVQFSMGDSL